MVNQHRHPPESSPTPYRTGKFWRDSSRFRRFCALLLLATWFSAPLAAERRARPPQWSPQESTDVFFEDAFRDALVGDRPTNLAPAATASSTRPATPTQTAPNSGTSGGAAPHPWRDVVDREVLEDEVKRLARDLNETITTPTNFAGRGYQDARRQFTMLTVLFGIIQQYDDNVRWQEDAGAARDAFAHVAAIAKVGSIQVYQAAKTQQQNLGDLIRGSQLAERSFDADATWGDLVDRGPIMQCMERDFQQRITRWTANRQEFLQQGPELVHHGQLLAALTRVLTADGMEDGDDEDYAEYCRQIEQAAQTIRAAVKSQNYEAAREATGNILKACDNCHESYRG